jgi:hypothetical protein
MFAERSVTWSLRGQGNSTTELLPQNGYDIMESADNVTEEKRFCHGNTTNVCFCIEQNVDGLDLS